MYSVSHWCKINGKIASHNFKKVFSQYLCKRERDVGEVQVVSSLAVDQSHQMVDEG